MKANLQEITEPREAALIYAGLGLAVVPIRKGTKQPPMKAWQKEATQDPEKIREWWDRWPEAGVGVVTGEKSGGLAVIDLDEHPEDGRRGVELLEAWERENGDPMKRQQHLYSSQVDFQTDGALVILPPTVHAKTGRRYKWAVAPDQRPLASYGGNAAAFIDEGYLEARGSQDGPRPAAGRTICSGCFPACRPKD